MPNGSKPISEAQNVCRARYMLTISMMLSENLFGRRCGNRQASRLSKRRERAIELECEKKSLQIDITVGKEVDGLKGWLSTGRMFGVGRLCRREPCDGLIGSKGHSQVELTH